MSKWGSVTLWMLCFFCFMPLIGNQTEYSFNHLSIEQKLPGASVHCVFQDHKGLMWFAIESVGLCKFDGENFTVYEKSVSDSNSISNNFPLCIVEDTTGNLWIGTTEGLNKFDRKKGVWERFLHSSVSENCIPNNYITNLFVDKQNNIWIATRAGASKYNPHENRFSNFLIGEGKYTDGLPAMISCFYEDKYGNIWIGSYSSGLFLIYNTSILADSCNSNSKLKISKHWFPTDNNSENSNYAVQQICKFDKNSLLLGKIDGLFLFNVKTEEISKYHVQQNSSLDNSTVSSLLIDNLGRIWVAYANKGLLLIDINTKQQNYFNAGTYMPKGIMSNSIRDVYEDKSGLIWIATKFQGIHTYDKRQEVFTKHLYNKVLNTAIDHKFILSILEDSKRNIWIGTKNNGLFKYNPIRGEIFNYSSEKTGSNYYINNDRIESIIEDSDGNIWIGTEHGISKLEQDKFKAIKDCNYFIRCMVADRIGNIWLGTNSSGVYYYDSDKKQTLRFQSEKKWQFFDDNNFGTRSITILSDSILWVSTFQNGLYKYNFQKDILSHYLNDPQDSLSISGNMVRDVVQLENGEIWISTKSNGLNIYNVDEDNFTRIAKKNGLPPNTIYNILEDDFNNYWMGSHEGLYTINRKTGNSNLYNTIYGLKNTIFEVNAKCKTHNGLIIFGGSEGLNVFNPKDVNKSEYNAPLIISIVKVYDKIIAEDLSTYTEISINHDDKYISIGFALTDYSDPLKVQYKYKLENFDKAWVEAGTQNYATYTSLPPGEYIFNVLAANSDNTWTSEPTKIAIKIASPFWRKPAFLIAFLVLISIIIIALYIARIQFIRKNELKLKGLVEIKTQDLRELAMKLEKSKRKAEESDKLKSAFLANLSHEIRTPMNGIIGFVDLLKVPELSGKDQKKYIDIIQKSGSRMLNIINDLIDISKIEAGQIAIIKETTYINPIIDELYAYYKPIVEKRNLILEHKKELPLKSSVIQADKLRITQILSNLINNALKFTREGKISFGYIKKEDCFEFFVSDTGIGIPADMVETVFERFRQAEHPEIELMNGTGLGLSLSRAFVELHGGKIWLDTTKKKGSTFYFTLPSNGTSYEDTSKDIKNIYDRNNARLNSLKDKKVLVVEDDEISLFFLQSVLEERGIKVFLAHNGNEAIDMVNSNPDIELILMDMKMPDMNGIEATKLIKKSHSHIPIIMQSAFAQSEEQLAYLQAGCDNFISKPIQRDLFLELISHYLIVE